METLRNFAIFDPNKDAVISCDHHASRIKLNYQDTTQISTRIQVFLSKIQEENVCIGLFILKNIFIPSIILSLQNLNHCFVFLTYKNVTKLIKDLKLKWILSFNNTSPEDDFTLDDALPITGKDVLYLWCCNTVIDDCLCFKDIFCVMQTSGSTGENKIVKVPHYCIENNVLSLKKKLNMSTNDIIYWGTPLTFDPTLVELLLGLFCQATLLIVPKIVSLNPNLLHQALFKVGMATFVQIVPSIFFRWSKEQIYDIMNYSNLRTLAFGGEPFPQDILKYDRKKDLKIYNLYGVTELSCWAMIFNVTKEISTDQVSLGVPLDETFIDVFNENDERISNGLGEICVGSRSRYCLVNSDEKSGKTYVVKTGDIAEINEKGIYYKGRKNRIVKRFGHKVNLFKMEEIILHETHLTARLLYSTEYKKLLAFLLIEEYFNRDTKTKLLDKLRVKLLKILPGENFPDYIDVVSCFPLNEHGKICDKILHSFYVCYLKSRAGSVFPSDAFKIILYKHLDTTITRSKEIEKHTFFELGGNSILAMQILSEFEEEIGIKSPGEFVTLLTNDTLYSCFDFLKKELNSNTFKRKLDKSSIHPEINSKLLKAETGKVLWTYDLKGCVDCSPVVFENSGNVYVAVGSFANVFAIIDENGLEYLNLILPDIVETKPCVSKCNNLIFIGCFNGNLYCIDFSLKTIIWEYPTNGKIKSSPCLCRESSAIVFGSYDNIVYCLNIQDGALLWKTPVSGSISSDCVLYEQSKSVFMDTTKGMCYSISETTGNIYWSYDIGSPIFGSPCIINENTIWPSVTGTLFCISWATGDLKWKFVIDGHIFSSLIVQAKNVYFGCHDCHLYELSILDNGCKITKTIKLDSKVSSSPFLYKSNKGMIVVTVCNLGVLYVIDISSGRIAHKFNLPGESFSSPSVYKNKIYLGCRDNYLYCIDISDI